MLSVSGEDGVLGKGGESQRCGRLRGRGGVRGRLGLTYWSTC